jgi:hypothetical protein
MRRQFGAFFVAAGHKKTIANVGDGFCFSDPD